MTVALSLYYIQMVMMSQSLRILWQLDLPLGPKQHCGKYPYALNIAIVGNKKSVGIAMLE